MKIKYKLILGFAAIFFVAVSIINPIIKNSIDKNNQTVVKRELSELSDNIGIYINQYLSIKNANLTKAYFADNSEKILDNLRDKLDYPMYFYNCEGINMNQSKTKEIFTSEIYNFKIQGILSEKKVDLQKALKGRPTFTVTKNDNEYYAVFSYPIFENSKVNLENSRAKTNTKIKTKTVGVLRLVKNYTTLYNSGNKMFYMFEGALMLLFVILIIIFTVFSYTITNPIEILNLAAKKMSFGDFDVRVQERSSDEIGQLSESFTIMQDRIKKQIEEMRRLEEHRKKFLDNVTHELKTPLTAISGYAQILNEIQGNDLEFLDVASKSIKREADRLNKMVINLLEMSNLNEESVLYEMKENNISNILLETVNDMKIKSDKYKFNINCDIQENVFAVCVGEQIRQVFINLLDNAIKYGEAGTTIDVGLKTEEMTSDISEEKVSNMPEGRTVNIYIKNYGKCIPDDMLDKIFEPFVRADKNFSRETGSSGLGLSIVKAIIDKHNGSISIRSKNGATEVIIKLHEFTTLQQLC